MSATYPSRPLTSYPDVAQAFNYINDIDITTLPLAQQYETYMSSGNFSAAKNLLESNSSLAACMITAKDYNTVVQTIEAMQLFITRAQQQSLLSTTEPTGDIVQVAGDIWLQTL